MIGPEGTAFAGGITALLLGSVLVLNRASTRKRSSLAHGRHRRQGRHHRVAA
ncbi:hypothetical protein [Sphaerisporangium rhizosphaerae]|uniref:LPXTG cell wall anchor domain-containing protein n=1 Tax=Sphaerisporangium rhizosphaerae TaxID=2269375 RepID=A0ABW2NXU5_9ACTN